MEKRVTKKKDDNTIHRVIVAPTTLGEKSSDALTKWAGSWLFIGLFVVMVTLWIWLNSYYFLQYSAGNAPDPYPFILLNLALSMLAAIQAPIILMSQNRASQIEKRKAEYNYAVNRKAEREIKELKELVLSLHILREKKKK